MVACTSSCNWKWGNCEALNQFTNDTRAASQASVCLTTGQRVSLLRWNSWTSDDCGLRRDELKFQLRACSMHWRTSKDHDCSIKNSQYRSGEVCAETLSYWVSICNSIFVSMTLLLSLKHSVPWPHMTRLDVISWASVVDNMCLVQCLKSKRIYETTECTNLARPELELPAKASKLGKSRSDTCCSQMEGYMTFTRIIQR